MRTLYEILGVERDASGRDIRSAYLRLAKLYHPDKHIDDGAASEQFSALQAAYEFLQDDEKREYYDAYLDNISRRLRWQKLRNGLIYATGFVTTFCIVFVGAKFYAPHQAIGPLATLPSPHFDAIDSRESRNTAAVLETARDAYRRDAESPAPESQSTAVWARDGDPGEQIQSTRPPPTPSAQVFEPTPRQDDRSLLNETIDTASNNTVPSEVATTLAPDTRQVRIWTRYRNDPAAGSRNPAVRVFTVEHERPDAGPLPEGIPAQKREVRVYATFRADKQESEIRVAPQVIAIERE